MPEELDNTYRAPRWSGGQRWLTDRSPRGRCVCSARASPVSTDAPAGKLSAGKRRFGEGEDEEGNVDGDVLDEWVRDATRALGERDRAHVASSLVGEVLSSAPTGSDGIWPAEAVRTVLERLDSHELEVAMHVKRYNSGTSVRYVGDASIASDRERAAQYATDADLLSARWPSTARLLRSLAASYSDDATRLKAMMEERER